MAAMAGMSDDGAFAKNRVSIPVASSSGSCRFAIAWYYKPFLAPMSLFHLPYLLPEMCRLRPGLNGISARMAAGWPHAFRSGNLDRGP